MLYGHNMRAWRRDGAGFRPGLLTSKNLTSKNFDVKEFDIKEFDIKEFDIRIFRGQWCSILDACLRILGKILRFRGLNRPKNFIGQA